MKADTDLTDRFDEFCATYDISEKHHGSLRMLSGMAYVLGLDIEVRLLPRAMQENEQ
jgi:hypothetical protein